MTITRRALLTSLITIPFARLARAIPRRRHEPLTCGRFADLFASIERKDMRVWRADLSPTALQEFNADAMPRGYPEFRPTPEAFEGFPHLGNTCPETLWGADLVVDRHMPPGRVRLFGEANTRNPDGSINNLILEMPVTGRSDLDALTWKLVPVDADLPT